MKYLTSIQMIEAERLVSSNGRRGRRKRPLFQTEWAKKLGVSRQTYSRWLLEEKMPDSAFYKSLFLLGGVMYNNVVRFGSKTSSRKYVLIRDGEIPAIVDEAPEGEQIEQ